MQQPVFYLLAGPNGAGKSSLYRAAVADGLIPTDAEFVNADLYEVANLRHIGNSQARSEQARQWADGRRADLLRSRLTFVSETVFSHRSKLDLIRQAKERGFAVVLLIVCLDNPQQLVARVRQRVREGGHNVPADRILARYPRTLENLASAVRIADMTMLFDTGNAVNDLEVRVARVAVCRGNTAEILTNSLPQWASIVLGSVIAGQ